MDGRIRQILSSLKFTNDYKLKGGNASKVISVARKEKNHGYN
jgi:hypothetical protein